MNVLPLFYPRKAKNAVTCLVTTFSEILKVVPPEIELFVQVVHNLYSIICQYPCFLPPIRFSRPSS